jgi:hypothetical protein
MKITKRHFRKIIQEELTKVLSEGEDWRYVDNTGGGSLDLEDIVQGEFQAWLKEQKAKANKFQPGLGAGGNVGKAATQRSQVFYKVKRTLMQDYGFIDDVDAYELKRDGEQVDDDDVVGVGKPIYKEIYAILYDLIPRPGR